MLVLSAMLVGLGAYIYFIESERPTSDEAASAKAKVFELESDEIEHLRVRASNGQTTVLQKREGAWVLLEPAGARVAEMEVTGVAGALESLELERIVEEDASDVSAFGLDEPAIDVGFQLAGESTMRHLQLGDTTATGGDLYARVADEPRVFLIAGYLESTFDRDTFDLRDKSILEFDRDEIDRLELTRNSGDVVAAKVEDRWTLETPWEARADSSTVESLVTRLQTLQMKSIVAEGDDDIDLESYGLAAPSTSVTLGAGSTRATLALGQATPTGDLYARDVSRSIVFTVQLDLLDDITKDAVDYRRKDIFDFRSWSASRLALDQGDATFVFEKRPPDEGEVATWQRVEPAGQIEEEAMQTLLSRLSGLKADSFAESRQNTGLETPSLIVEAQFDDGTKRERVQFARTADTVYAAAADDDSSPATIDMSQYDEVLAALAELTAND